MKTTEEIALNFQNKPLNTKWYSEEEHKLFIRMKKFFDENPEIRENYLYWLENKKIVKK